MHIEIRKSSMLPAQRAWWDLPNFIKAMVGGYGSGKTYIGALRAIYLSYVNAPYPGMYVSPTYPMAKKTIIIALKDMLDKAQIDYVYNKMEHQFVITEWNGNIWIGSGEVPASLKGPTLAWAGIDEPFIQDKEVFKQMNARVRESRASQREIFLTGTPEELNWGYDLINNDKAEYDIGFVVAKTIANIHNPVEYAKNLQAAYDENEQKAYMDGEFLNLTHGRVYKDFTRELLKVRDEPGGHPDSLKELPIECGMDFNVDALSCEIYRKGPGWIHFFDEIRLKNANTYDMAEALQKKYPGIAIYPDATGSARKTSATMSDHAILRAAGFTVRAPLSNPPVKDRTNAFNALMRNGNISFENCGELISDLERCTWRSGDIDKRDPERTHASDAAGYAVVYNFPVISRNVSYSPAW
ncbi:hypothetical protein LCGC14_1268430 [marine sediment metagenome]|uniref:Terminase large subunit gp17-like C-terminal domain-containing protein n=1 Tax=marine sediment metagenome TaxID=412755 RepID=A0A0F9LJQ3_9ZZZZ|nr:hypothetical protein [Desulfobacterales bacterium]